jgi:hypothetical protein
MPTVHEIDIVGRSDKFSQAVQRVTSDLNRVKRTAAQVNQESRKTVFNFTQADNKIRRGNTFLRHTRNILVNIVRLIRERRKLEAGITRETERQARAAEKGGGRRKGFLGGARQLLGPLGGLLTAGGLFGAARSVFRTSQDDERAASAGISPETARRARETSQALDNLKNLLIRSLAPAVVRVSDAMISGAEVILTTVARVAAFAGSLSVSLPGILRSKANNSLVGRAARFAGAATSGVGVKQGLAEGAKAFKKQGNADTMQSGLVKAIEASQAVERVNLRGGTDAPANDRAGGNIRPESSLARVGMFLTPGGAGQQQLQRKTLRAQERTTRAVESIDDKLGKVI